MIIKFIIDDNYTGCIDDPKSIDYIYTSELTPSQLREIKRHNYSLDRVNGSIIICIDDNKWPRNYDDIIKFNNLYKFWEREKKLKYLLD